MFFESIMFVALCGTAPWNDFANWRKPTTFTRINTILNQKNNKEKNKKKNKKKNQKKNQKKTGKKNTFMEHDRGVSPSVGSSARRFANGYHQRELFKNSIDIVITPSQPLL